MNNLDIYKEFYDRLLSFFNQRVLQKEDARDLVQEVFLKISRHQGQKPVIKNISGWVFTIAHHTLIDYYRKNKRRFSPYEEALEPEEVDQNEKLTGEITACIKLFLSQLSPETRMILEWVEINKGSQKSLAAQLNLPYPTLRSKVRRGRKAILKLLQESCHMSFDARGWVVHCESKCQPNNACHYKC